MPYHGKTSCLVCSTEKGKGYWSTTGATECDTCLASYYRDGDECFQCDDSSMACDVEGATLEELPVQVGYYRFTLTSPYVYDCAAWKYSANCRSTNANNITEGRRLLSAGAKGEDFRYRGESKVVLERLTFHGGGRWMDDLGGLDVSTADAAREAGSHDLEAASKKKPERTALRLHEAWQNTKTKVKIMWTFSQLLSGFGFVLDVRFPNPYSSVAAALGNLNLSFFQLAPVECTFPDSNFFTDLAFSTSWPIVVAVVLLSLHVRNRANTQTYFSLFLILTYLVLPGASSKIFSAFKCDEFIIDDDTTRYFVAVDYSIECDSDDVWYRPLLALAVAMAVVYVIGIPTLYSVLLYRAQPELSIVPKVELSKMLHFSRTHRKEASKQLGEFFFGDVARGKVVSGGNQAAEEAEWEESSDQHQLAFLIGSYEQRTYWFEVVEVSRRLALSGCLVLFGPGSTVQGVVSVLICLLSIKVYGYWAPLRDDKDDLLQEVAQWQLFFVLFAALLQNVDATGDSSADQAVLGWLLIAFVIPGYMMMVWTVVEPCFARNQQQPDSTRSEATGQELEAADFDISNPLHGADGLADRTAEPSRGTPSGGGGGGGGDVELTPVGRVKVGAVAPPTGPLPPNGGAAAKEAEVSSVEVVPGSSGGIDTSEALRAKQAAAKLEWEHKFGGRASLTGASGRRSSFSAASFEGFTTHTEPAALHTSSLGAGNGGSANRGSARAKRRSSLASSWKPAVEAFTVGAAAQAGGGHGGAAEEGGAAIVTVAGVEMTDGESVWAEVTTEDGQTYYHNTATDETSWTKPEIELKNTPTGTVAGEQGSTGHSADI